MSRTYTRLPLAVGAWQTNFVALPQEFVKAIRDSPDFANQGVVALRLNWTALKPGATTETEVKESYVGWNGAITRGAYIQVPEKLGELTGLSAALSDSRALGGSGLVINVYAVRGCEIARRVDVEPETFDDWEKLERHAGFVETQMLSQICVLFPNQRFTVWVANAPVTLLVKSGVNAPCIKLANDTEVVVEPKPRPGVIAPSQQSKEAKSKTEESERGKPVILRVQPMPLEDDIQWNGVVLVNSSTLELMREVAQWDVAGEDVSEDGPAVSRTDPKAIAACRIVVGSESSSSSNEGDIVCGIQICSAIANGHVGMSRATRRLIVKPFSRIKLAPASLTAIFKDGISLRRVIAPSSFSSKSSPTETDVVDTAKLSLQKDSAVVSDGTWLNLGSSLGVFKISIPSKSSVSARVLLGRTEGIKWSLGEDVPTSSLRTRARASDSEEKDDEEDEIESQLDRTWGDDVECFDMVKGDWTLKTIGGPAKRAGKDLVDQFAPLLSSTASRARARLGTPPSGGAYLFGSRGSGKSTLIRAMAKSLGEDPDYVTCVVRVNCAPMKGGKRSLVQRRLERAVLLAQSRAPSLLVFEDLDALLPQPANAGEEDAQTVWLSEFVEGLIGEARAKQDKFEQVALEAVRRKKLSSVNDLPAWNKVAVGFLATGRARKSLRTALTRLGVFEHRVEMPSLDLQARKDVLSALCSLKAGLPTPSENEMDVVGARTEGFTPGDLETLVERALHARALDEIDQVIKDSNERTYLQQALEGFTPSSLRGVKLAKSDTQWSDVGGLDSVRHVLKETLELPFQFAELYDRSPQRLASGILLYGPPGCGKTLLAGAVASECGLNFISVKGPEVLNKYIGASEQAIRDLFARAASVTPCIIFFDEFDAVAPRRGSDSTGVTDRVVNQMLTFLDGVESRKGVYVMAATSRPDLVDPALLRPGRLDKQLYCGFPNEAERLSILDAVSRKVNLAVGAREKTLPQIAASGKELTGADLQAMCATAQLLAVHEDSLEVTSEHLLRAMSDTRPSVGKDDRAKFDRIYRQFRGDRQAPSLIENDIGFFSEDAKQKVALM